MPKGIMVDNPTSNNGVSYSTSHTAIMPAVDNSKVLKILMLEDDENDAMLIQTYLQSSSLNVECTIVSTKEDYIQKLEQEEFDVILSDHKLPQFNSLEALQIRNTHKAQIPFILVTGEIPEEYAVTILQEGANDYILKDRPKRLITAITEAIKKQVAISEKILAERELKIINERLRLVGKATADAVWDWDILTNELIWGEGFEILFGYKLKDQAPDINSWKDHIHPDDKTRVVENITEFLSTKKVNWQDEYRYIKNDGSFAIVLDKGIVLRDENGKAYRMVGAMQDITHVRKLEIEIGEQRLDYQKQNTEIAIQSQERERSHIGKELHDNINQLIASAKMMIDTARNSPEIHDICIDKSYEAITMAMEEVRKLSHKLVIPSFTDSTSLSEAVNDIVANIQFADPIDITVNISADITLPDEIIKLTLYRIIQEQLTNILKHAKASKASITLQQQQNNYLLVIADNGIGFDCEKRHKGIGLRNISSRAEMLLGTSEIISAPGEGCTLKIKIPYLTLHN